MRVRAKRADIGDRIGQGDHGIGSSVLFSVEGRWVFGIEAAGRGVLGFVEPEPNMECVSGSQAGGRIEAEDLVEKNRLDRDLGLTISVRLHVRLIPSQSEILEVRVDLAVGQQIGVLYGEKIEAKVGLEMVGVQDEHVTELAPLHDDVSGRLGAPGIAETVDEFRLRDEVKGNFGHLRHEGRYDAEEAQGNEACIQTDFH